MKCLNCYRYLSLCIRFIITIQLIVSGSLNSGAGLRANDNNTVGGLSIPSTTEGLCDSLFTGTVMLTIDVSDQSAVHDLGRKLVAKGHDANSFFSCLYVDFFTSNMENYSEVHLNDLSKLSSFNPEFEKYDGLKGNISFYRTIIDAARDELASKIQYLITQGNHQKEEYAKYIDVLEEHGYVFFEKPNNVTKTINYLKRGEFSYVFKKLTGTYKYEFISFITILVVALFLFYRLLIRKKFTNLKFQLLFLSIIFYSFGVVAVSEPNFSDKRLRNLSNDFDINLYQISLEGQEYGAAIWAESEKIGAKYLVFNNPFERTQEWGDSGKTIFVTCAGNYATGENNSKSEGLTFEDGRVINRILVRSLDALVLINGQGNFDIYDIRNEPVDVDGDELKLHNPIYRQSFIDWVEADNLSVFQTHLLVSDGQLRLNSQRTNDREAHRRFLAQIQDNNTLYTVLVNIPQNITLGQATEDMLAYFRDYKKVELIKLINLDTGFYDILEVHDADGNKLNIIEGSRPVDGAASLVNLFQVD